MTEIKRLNYFTSQFLVEKDFKDEQAYHRRMRHLHNRSLHTWGVVEGLAITKSGDKQVSVGSGIAIDSSGKEIVVLDEQPADIKTISLSEFDPGSTVYITLAAEDFEHDQDRQTLGSEIKYTRTTERPQLEASLSQSANDGAVIILAKVTLDGNGNVNDSAIDYSERPLASAIISPKAIGADELDNDSVTNAKIADNAVNAAKIQNGTVGTAELANNSATNEKIADNAINAAKIADNAITESKIANNSISKIKLDAETRNLLDAAIEQINTLKKEIKEIKELLTGEDSSSSST